MPPSEGNKKTIPPDQHPLGRFVRRFLLEQVAADRNLSLNTQRSYRDTIRLLLRFIDGIHALVTRTVEKAAENTPSLQTKRVSPHTIRHTTAVHLLRAGVDINAIRAWLATCPWRRPTATPRSTPR